MIPVPKDCPRRWASGAIDLHRFSCASDKVYLLGRMIRRSLVALGHLFWLLSAPLPLHSQVWVDIKTVESEGVPKLHPRLIRSTDNLPAGAGTRCFLLADTAKNGLGSRTESGLRLGGDDTVIWQGAIDVQSPILRPGAFAGYGIQVPPSLARSKLYLVAVEPLEGSAGFGVGSAELGAGTAPELGNAAFLITTNVFLFQQSKDPVADVLDPSGGGGGNNSGSGDPGGPSIVLGPLAMIRLPEQGLASVRFPTTWGIQYQLESKQDVDSPEWEPWATVLGDGQAAEVVVGANDRLRLFRLRLTTIP